MGRITDAGSTLLDDYRHLTDAAARRAVESPAGRSPNGILIAEGRVAIEQLVASGLTVRSVLATPERADAAAALTADRDVPLLVAPRDVLAAVTGYDVHRGLLAAANRPAPTDPSTFVAAGDRFVLVEAVNDNENIGAIFRNVAALGLGAIVLDRRCADPFYRRSIRVSSGWTLRVPHTRVAELDAVTDQLKGRGVRLVALTPAANAVAVDRAASEGLLDDPVALMVGSEGHGLDAGSLDLADVCVSVPMQPGVDSLNVATTVAVVGAFLAARADWTDG